MKIIGIICEYNPFHLGHKKQLSAIRSQFGGDCGIVCLMSGNFVQRGAPAVFDKSLRAQAAVLCGADLVLELPTNYALSSAEGFAAGGVAILSKICDTLCFGTESGRKDTLLATASALLDPDFSLALRTALDTGASFPAARCTALEKMDCSASLLKNPNDILAVEYCKAILSQNCALDIFPIYRGGNYHDTKADTENPSATAIRKMIMDAYDWKSCVPQDLHRLYENAEAHTLAAGERAILYRLRSMTDKEFEALPYGSEGLWRKLMHESRSRATLEEILEGTKSKRYTRSRLDRMVMCAYLGITKELLEASAPYTRVLAFNDTGKAILKSAKEHINLLHTGQRSEDPYWHWEQKWDDLYGLFSVGAPDSSGKEQNRRVYISGSYKTVSP